MQISASSPVVVIDAERCHQILDVDRMPAFLMSLTNASDVWAYLTSNGGITAGRRSADHAIFPYRTEDLIADDQHVTGGVIRLRVTTGSGEVRHWRPFEPTHPELPRVERSLAKSDLGDVIHLIERRPDLHSSVRITWRVSPRWGLVRTVTLTCEDTAGVQVQVMDGMLNVLPPGVTARTQREFAPLLDAYKLTELDPATGLAWVRLNSALTDRAEAAESLAATVMWQVGASPLRHHLSAQALEHWGHASSATQARGTRAAYLVESSHHLTPQQPARWHVVADVDTDAAAVVELQHELADPARLQLALEADIAAGRSSLRALVGAGDGWSHTGDLMADAHLAASTMFNIMRGGVPLHGYTVAAADASRFVAERNAEVAYRCADLLGELPEHLDLTELRQAAIESGDVDLSRIIAEYLPLAFARRHGDPSRPWNVFDIDLQDERGAPRLAYQGNWRDIFQNWEALAWSFPELTESMVRAFLNATTIDGYNPYRVFRQGVEWEVPEPEDPWSNIGYWSDHQIIYLLKLLELLHGQHPRRLAGVLTARDFVHVDVPYRLATYEQLLTDAQNSVFFDAQRHTRSSERVRRIGGDGRLLVDDAGSFVRSTLVEKLLILLGAKMVNFVPEGGIWMTTQRPEWNDGNNALVGRGLSIVTAAQLYRFVDFTLALMTSTGDQDGEIEVNQPLADLVQTITAALHEPVPLEGRIDDRRRRAILDRLGQAGTTYRSAVAQHPDRRVSLGRRDVCEHLRLVREWLGHTVRSARRRDGLYHAYNIIELGEDTVAVGHLDEMLEGQVAVLSSGALGPQEVDALVAALPQSRLYRADVNSYQLYPEPHIAGFLERNLIPTRARPATALFARLVADGHRGLVVGDPDGRQRFAAGIRNAVDVRQHLDCLLDDERYAQLAAEAAPDVLALFEEVFRHGSFTGRSSSFFAYEGVGSVYWHMVSKLVLALREQVDLARLHHPGDLDRLDRLAAAYEQARSGLGMAKTAQEYGAFPHDPYSHTPAGRGARQPGMTGQVKEDILIRRAELGVSFVAGRIRLDGSAIAERDWSAEPGELAFVDVHGREQREPLPRQSLGFTLAQVPVVLQRSCDAEQLIEVFDGDGLMEHSLDGHLSEAASADIIARRGRVRRIVVSVPQR